MIEIYSSSSIEWKPSAVVALATSISELHVAVAREDGSVEIWLISPGSICWHCQLTIHGSSDSRISSLAWCSSFSKGKPYGRLFSSSIDGSVSEWDLIELTQKESLVSIGVSIWEMAFAPHPETNSGQNGFLVNKFNSDESTDSDESDVDEESTVANQQIVNEIFDIALGCDDGSVRLYNISDLPELTFKKSLPRVSGKILSVVWSLDGKRIYSGSSDGFIRCWDARSSHEVYRITAGLGGLHINSDLCIWSLLSLRCGTLVSADSAGSVQFWDTQHGTLIQAHTFHKGDVNALAAAPGHNQVFSGGSDGQVILYNLSQSRIGSDDGNPSEVMRQWIYIGYIRSHTHDIRALSVVVPISRESQFTGTLQKSYSKNKPTEFSYHKWAHTGVPMLISGGDDTKLYAYSTKEFTKFSPHDICPTPQSVPVQLVQCSDITGMPLVMVQTPFWLDIIALQINLGTFRATATELLARVKSRSSRRVICSAISSSGAFFAYSDNVNSSLFELNKDEINKSVSVRKRKLSFRLPCAHCIIFSFDSSLLMMSGHDRFIYVMDIKSSQLLYTLKPCLGDHNKPLASESHVTKMFTSCDRCWLACIDCFGDIYIFDLETQRQHWFISRLDGASVTAGGFPPENNDMLIVTTSCNQVYTFDVKRRELGEWCKHHTRFLPRRFQEFPGEVIGICFVPSPTSSTSVVVYSARAMCEIDLKLVDNKKQKCHSKNKLKRKMGAEGDGLEGKGDGDGWLLSRCFKHPVLFMGTFSQNSVLIIDKPWMDVVKSLDVPPVHRHVYGT